jgi:molecular chaperone GrpE (heat shock protein)
MPGFAAACRRVEDDANAHKPDDFGRASLVEQKATPLLAPATDFSETGRVNEPQHWKVPKWLFLLGDALLLATAYVVIRFTPHPIGHWEIVTVAACVALGAILGVLPFILDYRAIVKVIEASALGSIGEKIQNLEKLAAQISSATNEWTNAQTQAEITVAGAKQITKQMTEEVRQFSEFMQKMNDSEKTALRLEIDKMRRGEAEWLQVLVRIFDHIFALNAAAARSGQPKLAEQIAQFQNACCDAARRIGLSPFVPKDGEPFDITRHRLLDSDESPPADSLVAETAVPGFRFQGRLLRPALVRLQATPAPEESPVADSAVSAEPTEENAREIEPASPAEPAQVQVDPTEREIAEQPQESQSSEQQLPLGSPD